MKTEDKERRADTEKASQLFLQYYDYVRYIAWTGAPEESLIDDIVNDAFVSFVSQATDWNMTDDVKPLLRSITLNHAKRYWDYYTNKLPKSLRKLALHVQSRTREQLGDTDETRERISALTMCMKKLPERDRRLIEEHYLEGAKLIDMAQSWKMNILTLRNLMFRIRRSLLMCARRVLKGVFIDDTE